MRKVALAAVLFVLFAYAQVSWAQTRYNPNGSTGTVTTAGGTISSPTTSPNTPPPPPKPDYNPAEGRFPRIYRFMGFPEGFEGKALSNTTVAGSFGYCYRVNNFTHQQFQAPVPAALDLGCNMRPMDLPYLGPRFSCLVGGNDFGQFVGNFWQLDREYGYGYNAVYKERLSGGYYADVCGQSHEFPDGLTPQKISNWGIVCGASTNGRIWRSQYPFCRYEWLNMACIPWAKTPLRVTGMATDGTVTFISEGFWSGIWHPNGKVTWLLGPFPPESRVSNLALAINPQATKVCGSTGRGEAAEDLSVTFTSKNNWAMGTGVYAVPGSRGVAVNSWGQVVVERLDAHGDELEAVILAQPAPDGHYYDLGSITRDLPDAFDAIMGINDGCVILASFRNGDTGLLVPPELSR